MKIREFKKVADILAKKHRITIMEDTKWAANFKTRVVHYIKKDIYNLPEEHILGFILHEIAHIHYSTEIPDKEIEKMNEKELMHEIINMLEDIAIENIISYDYPNAGEILESTRDEVIETLNGLLPKMKQPDQIKSILYASTSFYGKEKKEKKERPYEICGEKIATLMKKNPKNILNRKKTEDLVPLAKEIQKIIEKDLGKLPKKDKDKINKKSKINFGKIGKDGSKIKQLIRNQLKLKNGWNKKEAEKSDENIILIDSIADQAEKNGKNFRKILKRNNTTEYGGRYRTGKLETKRLIRIKTVKDRHPFSRRIVKSNKSYTFAIAADVSGSMRQAHSYDDKNTALNYTLSSTWMAAEAMKYAKIPRSVTIFGRKAITIVPTTKKKIRWEEIINGENIEKADPGDTDIGDAIEKATEEIKKTNTERKIMIVITDGYSYFEGIKQAYKRAIKNNIECFSISIGDSDILDKIFREKNITIKNSSQTEKISEAIEKILKETIKRNN